MRNRLLSFTFMITVAAQYVYGCAMSEEMKRIQEKNATERMRAASLSSNLTGEQLFVRSCNTCHPGGKSGLGPALTDLPERFPEDDALRAFIRKGKGIMPGQSAQSMNDQELDNLIAYLRVLTAKS
jgi:cytochrome c2